MTERMFKKTDSVDSLTKDLNDPQKEAVTGKPGNYLILAGAGSGKTRVLVHRLAYLVKHYGLDPTEVMAVTFTNKAAREMSERVDTLLKFSSSRNLWIGTFHSIANRILRRHARLANLKSNFEIIGVDDQKRVFKDILTAKKISSDNMKPSDLIGVISRWKDQGLRAADVAALSSVSGRQASFLPIYSAYEEYCQSLNLVDFGELLLRCLELWQYNDDILASYRSRFPEILVDEFQDTNAIQFEWIRTLAGQKGNVMAVGDDDQSIYGWRGAVVGNIREFPDWFKDTKTIRLEENYRSTAHILNAANELIDHNDDRLGKTLWTQAKDGEGITIHQAPHQNEEAEYVVRELIQWVAATPNRTYDDVAVLYRNNQQSRAVEAELTKRDIKYTVRGGTRFYDRQEIRNALGYMRLVSDKSSDVAFDRVIAAMPRGIGVKSQELINEYAEIQGLSKWEAITQATSNHNAGPFPRGLTNALATFIADINKLSKLCEGKELREIARICIESSGLKNHYLSQKSELGHNRVDNLNELIAACSFIQKDFAEDPSQNQASLLTAFLDAASLDPGDVRDPDEPSVSLLTLHSAKGLEFPLVLIIGMLEGIFPHSLNKEGERLLEERRLAYVGVTRAMEKLYLTHYRYFVGGTANQVMFRSRFLDEIPIEHLDSHGAQVKRIQEELHPRKTSLIARRSPPSQSQALGTRYDVGDRVFHAQFGHGWVRDVRGHSSSERVMVEFEDGSRKHILASVGQLRKRD